jgi:putative phosphotransacetylase
MMMNQIVEQVKAALAKLAMDDVAVKGIPVGISNRHIHLSASDCEKLFGWDHGLTRKKDLKQTGEFAAAETVTLVGPKGVIQGVRVLGPLRQITQLEISRTDGFSLGISPPVRDSGDIAKSASLVVVGPSGTITLTEGVICAARHIHMNHEDAKRFDVSDGDRIMVETDGLRGCILKNVLVRVHPSFRLEFHIDTDEANAVGLSNGDHVRLPQWKEA